MPNQKLRSVQSRDREGATIEGDNRDQLNMANRRIGSPPMVDTC
jgi:hypothetical protein